MSQVNRLMVTGNSLRLGMEVVSMKGSVVHMQAQGGSPPCETRDC